MSVIVRCITWLLLSSTLQFSSATSNIGALTERDEQLVAMLGETLYRWTPTGEVGGEKVILKSIT